MRCNDSDAVHPSWSGAPAMCLGAQTRLFVGSNVPSRSKALDINLPAGTKFLLLPVCRGAHRVEICMPHINPDKLGLDTNDANCVALPPLSFIVRTAFLYPNQVAMIHGASKKTGKEHPLPINHSPSFAPVPEPPIKTAVETMSLADSTALQC